MPVTSVIWVGLHLSCFGQAAPTLLGLDVARALDVIPDATRGSLLTTTSGEPAHHDVAEWTPRWDLRTSPDGESSGSESALDVSRSRLVHLLCPWSSVRSSPCLYLLRKLTGIHTCSDLCGAQVRARRGVKYTAGFVSSLRESW